MFLIKLPRFQVEEMAAIYTYLTGIIDKIYEPTLKTVAERHNELSKSQFNTFASNALQRAPSKTKWRLRRDENLFTNKYCFKKDKLGCRSRNDGRVTSNLEWYADASHQKWIVHLVSRGLGLAFHCHAQLQKDSGVVNPEYYPHQHYQQDLFYRAPTEVFRA